MSIFLQKIASSMAWRAKPGATKRLAGAVKLPGLPLALAALLLLFTALALGVVVALGSAQLTLFLAGLLLVLPVVFLIRTTTLLPIMFVSVFFIQGTVQYFFDFRAATWMASGLCALFFLRALIELTNFDTARKARPAGAFGAAALLVAATLYLLLYFFSMSLGHATVLQLISSVRFCIPMFGVLFAFYWFRWEEGRMHLLWMLVVGIAIAQLPLVAYQHFFMMSTLGWDGVVGSFGKNMSPILILFTVGAMVYMLARWTNGVASTWSVLAVCLVCMAVVLLGEVKAVFVWLPIGVFWVLRRRILRNVAAFIVFFALLSVFAVGTFAVYKALYWGDYHTRGATIEETLDSVGGYAVDPNGMNYATGEISRGASLSLWYRDPVPSVHERLVGYGPGASMTSGATGKGVVAARYRSLQIGATGLATLLWDVGILGTLAFVSILLIGVLLGWRYSSSGKAGPARVAMVDACTVMVLLYLTTLIYNRSLLDEPAAQLLCYFCLGCIVQCARFPDAARSARAAAPGGPAKP